MASTLSIKPGVIFLQTATGGALLDVAADKYFALRPLSAQIWRQCHAGEPVASVLNEIEKQGFDSATARRVLEMQLRTWRHSGLLEGTSCPEDLPVLRAVLGTQPLMAFQPAPVTFNVGSMASLYLAERTYRRCLRTHGLAKTIVRLQRGLRERRLGDATTEVSRIIKGYHLLRRAFRQGETSRDCLIRSLALSAVLRANGLDAHLCIGILEMPFESHAWVEWNGHVLNDSLRKVATYTPIARF